MLAARNQTIHDPVTKLKEVTHAFTRGIPDNFAVGLTTRHGNPDLDLARDQKAQRIEAVKAAGAQVVTLPSHGNPDETYFRDIAMEHNGVIFISNPATPSRKAEVKPAIDELSEIFRDVVPWLGLKSATIEFGDVVYMGSHTYSIGLSERTTREGALVLMSALREVDPEVKFVMVPVSNVLHLETGATPVASSIVLQDPHMPLPKWFNDKYNVFTVPNQNGYAASVLTINDTVLVAQEHLEVKLAVASLDIPGLKVTGVPTSETERMDGSLPCDFMLSNSHYGGMKKDAAEAIKALSR